MKDIVVLRWALVPVILATGIAFTEDSEWMQQMHVTFSIFLTSGKHSHHLQIIPDTLRRMGSINSAARSGRCHHSFLASSSFYS